MLSPLFSRLPPLVLGGVVLLGLGFRCLDRFAGAGHDDAYITLLAAEQLASGQGFVTANGEPGEIGSSLLHVLLLAALSWLGVPDLLLANKFFGLCAGAATLALIVRHRDALFAQASSPLVAATLAAGWAMWLPTYAFWTMGGLETPLVSLLLTGLALSLLRIDGVSGASTGVVVFMLTLARPEGFVYLSALPLYGLLVRARKRWWIHAVVAPLTMYLVVSAVRGATLGSPMPLPVLAKAGDFAPWHRMGAGVAYLFGFARASRAGTLFVLATLVGTLVGLRRHASRDRLADLSMLAPSFVAMTHLCAVMASGGDWMAYYRFVAPAIPLMSVVLFQLLFGFGGLRAARPPFQMALASMLLALIPWGTRERSGLSPPYMHDTCMQRSITDLFDEEIGSSLGERVRRLNHPHWRDEHQLRPFLVHWLKSFLARRGTVTLATYQMGFLPYELRRLGMSGVRLVDTFGIVDPVLARLPGDRGPLGLNLGNQPAVFLNPESRDAVSREIQARKPELLYVLHIDDLSRARLETWGWMLVWDAPEAKVFAYADAARVGR